MNPSLTRKPNSTADLIELAAARYGEQPFIVDGETTLSFSQTLADVRALAAALLKDGFKTGDRAAIWAPNGWEWILAALAVQYIGGTLVTLNTRYKGQEAAAVLKDSGATLLFVINEFLGSHYPALLNNEDCGHVETIVTLRGGDNAAMTFEHWLDDGHATLNDELAQSAVIEARMSVTGDTVSDILFTSGTTGRAKGVMTRHQQNIEAFSEFASILGLNDRDRYLIINPFFHSFGYKAGWLAALLSGCVVYPVAVFDVEDVLQQVARHQITVLPGPPTLFQTILQHPQRNDIDLNSLRKATTGAASIPTQLIIDIQNELGIDTLLTAYGLSESCGLVSMCRPGDAPEVIATTSGRAIPGVELAIMDDSGALLGDESTGEIVVRGFNVMAGYLDNPEATTETIDAQGWLHTGDIGSLDSAGNLRITDRLKDMYISGGFNCYPAEIENQLLGHPDIAQAAVIGIPDERMGEVGVAYLIFANTTPPTAQQLTDWCRERIANYKVPRHFIAISELPLNASGKVLKTALRSQMSEHSYLT